MNIYGKDPMMLFLVSFVVLVGWTALLCFAKKRRKVERMLRIVGILLMIVAVYGILEYSVLKRNPSDDHNFVWVNAYNSEFERELFMNALLYYPLGLGLTVLIGPWSILVGFMLSVSIETWQYIAGTGLAQGTDVLMNTLGCAIGALPWFLSKMMKKRSIKNFFRPFVQFAENSWFSVPCCFVLDTVFMIRYKLLGRVQIADRDRKNVEENVTFIFKSFNRQKMAKRLNHCIQSYYPKAAIVIADDSVEPLQIENAHILHLPFNSGLSKGLIAALNEVKTDYVMRLDDDLLLTPKSNIHKQLAFLQSHPEVDLSAIQMSTRPEKAAKEFDKIKMRKELIIPAGTVIDGHCVVYKAPNCFLARTEKLRAVGYDPNIRMIDHHEFFYRAAGVIVSVQDPHAYAFHCHNRFDRDYRKYRNDIAGDSAYIRIKHGVNRRTAEKVSQQSDEKKQEKQL